MILHVYLSTEHNFFFFFLGGEISFWPHEDFKVLYYIFMVSQSRSKAFRAESKDEEKHFNQKVAMAEQMYFSPSLQYCRNLPGTLVNFFHILCHSSPKSAEWVNYVEHIWSEIWRSHQVLLALAMLRVSSQKYAMFTNSAKTADRFILSQKKGKPCFAYMLVKDVIQITACFCKQAALFIM